MKKLFLTLLFSMLVGFFLHAKESPPIDIVDNVELIGSQVSDVSLGYITDIGSSDPIINTLIPSRECINSVIIQSYSNAFTNEVYLKKSGTEVIQVYSFYNNKTTSIFSEFKEVRIRGVDYRILKINS